MKRPRIKKKITSTLVFSTNKILKNGKIEVDKRNDKPAVGNKQGRY